MLTRFLDELEQSGRRGETDYHLVWRYTKGGKLPRILTWLVRHPQLAAALAEDAQALAGKATDDTTKGVMHTEAAS